VEVTVRRVENGAMSGHLHDRVKEGDRLELPPLRLVHLHGPGADSIVLIGGGVGITRDDCGSLPDRHGWRVRSSCCTRAAPA
jgi:hypothetical protein